MSQSLAMDMPGRCLNFMELLSKFGCHDTKTVLEKNNYPSKPKGLIRIDALT